MYIHNKTIYLLVGFKTMIVVNTDTLTSICLLLLVVDRVSDVLVSNNKYVTLQCVRDD
jgi:hypothetical protein